MQPVRSNPRGDSVPSDGGSDVTRRTLPKAPAASKDLVVPAAAQEGRDREFRLTLGTTRPD